MNPDSKINLVLILIAFLVILVSLLTALAFGELFFETNIEDDVLTITGFTDDEYVGVALKNSEGMMMQTTRGELDAQGSFTIQMNVPYPSGLYQLLIGSSTNHETHEIFIGEVIEVEEIEIEEMPYGGEVALATIETPELEALLDNGIPEWVKEVFVMWADGYISDLELIKSIEYLIKIGTIKI